jgi:hypothetical protein
VDAESQEQQRSEERAALSILAMKERAALLRTRTRLDREAQSMAVTFHIPLEVWENIGPNTTEILTVYGPQALLHHATAAMHYGDNAANALGPAGQFADIWRKIMPLRRAMWEGAELTREEPEEILRDLVGHVLLALRMYGQGLDRTGDPTVGRIP